MNEEIQPRWEQLAGRYGLAGQSEWRKLLTHFDLSEGFALIVLLVLDADGAALCRHELEQHLHSKAKKLIAIDLPTPAALRQLPGHFLDTAFSPNDACLWLAAVEPDYSKTFVEWRDAWQHTLARLNAFRNPIREKLPLSIIFAGAPWLQEVMRETAPDLWSVRALVARIEPLPQTLSQLTNQTSTPPPELSDNVGGGDPLFALREAGKLRGVPGKELVLANLLHRAGDGFANLQDWNSADKAYTESLDLKRRFDASAQSLATTLAQLAVARRASSQLQSAILLFDQAMRIGRAIGNRRMQATILGNLASIYLELGDVQQAINLTNEQLVIAREIGDRKLEGSALGNLGNTLLRLNQDRNAAGLFEQRLAIARETSDRRGEGSALGGLGLAYGSLGDLRKAIEYFQQSLRIGREIGDRQYEIACLGNLGNAFLSLGHVSNAIDYLEQALTTSQKIGCRYGEARTLGNLGNAYKLLGNTQREIDYLEQSLKLHREIGAVHGVGACLSSLGSAYGDLGNKKKAIECFDQALVIARKISDRRLEADTLWNSALVLEKLADQTQAIARAEAALTILQAIEDPETTVIRDKLAKWQRQK